MLESAIRFANDRVIFYIFLWKEIHVSPYLLYSLDSIIVGAICRFMLDGLTPVLYVILGNYLRSQHAKDMSWHSSRMRRLYFIHLESQPLLGEMVRYKGFTTNFAPMQRDYIGFPSPTILQ